MTSFRLPVIVLLAIILVCCESKKKFITDTRLFHHWVNNDSLHPGGFVISADSIFYPDYDSSFPYVIDKDSIEVFFKDKTSKSAYCIQPDRLKFTSKEGEIIFWQQQ